MKLHCNKCQTDTNQEILSRLERHWEYDGAQETENWDRGPVYMRHRYSIVECKGCDEVAFLLEDDYNFVSGDDISAFSNDPSALSFEATETVVYPPRTFRRLPRWFYQIPNEIIVSLLREIYDALQNNSLRLAMMGIRSVIDQMLTSQVGNEGTFRNRLDAYGKESRVGRRTIDAITAVIDAGSAAVHRAYLPTDDQIIHAVEAIEHILHEIYVLPKSTTALETATPKRPRNQPPRHPPTSEA